MAWEWIGRHENDLWNFKRYCYYVDWRKVWIGQDRGKDKLWNGEFQRIHSQSGKEGTLN